MAEDDYEMRHWTAFAPGMGIAKGDAIEIHVDDRAATRKAIIDRVKNYGFTFIERWAWHAQPPKEGLRQADIWDYSDIVIHHAGHSYVCATNEYAAKMQIQKIQRAQMKGAYDDIGYHYAVSCNGELFEARDIRFIGEHVKSANTGKIGIVMLEDMADAGEAWRNEYSIKSVWDKLWHVRDIIADHYAPMPQRPTSEQVNALSALIKALLQYFNITRLGGHREYQVLAPGHEGRACPGKYGMKVVGQMRSRFGLAPPLE